MTDIPEESAAARTQAGLTFHRRGILADARESYRQALALDPHCADALQLLGVVEAQSGNYRPAAELFARAIGAGTDTAPLHNNFGNVLRALRRFDEALAHLTRAVKLDPGYAVAYCNRGDVLWDLTDYPAALASYEAAVRLDSRFATAHVGAARCLLMLGEYALGWARYEWRLDPGYALAAQFPKFSLPRWDGTAPLSERTLLLYAEQGLGDTLQFCRYAPLVAERGARVLLMAPRTLVPVLGSLPGLASVLPMGPPPPGVDYACALMSLPRVFGIQQGVPAFGQAGYLRADARRAAAWGARIGARTRPRVGVVWSGSPNPMHQERSVALREFARLFTAEFDWVSLQPELRAGDRESLDASVRLRHFGAELGDFADTAALVDAVDAVVTVDTSVAHLAGAMGKKVWILLPYASDWRWLRDRGDTPWYPSARLVRQLRRDDWSEPLAQVARELELFRDAAATRTAN